MTAKHPEHVCVVGGGVIGAMSAWYLSQRGCRVTIVDQQRFGAACSHGNCGYVSTSHVLPLAQPGAVREALMSVFRPNSPLSVRLGWTPKLWQWMWRFYRQCNRSDMMESARGRHLLLQSSLELYKDLFATQDIDCEWYENGLMFVFASDHHFEDYHKTNQLLTDEFGVSAQPLTGRQLVEKDPALKSDLAGAWYYPEDCHLRPDKLMEGLRRSLEKRDAQIIDEFPVDQFKSERGRCRSVGAGNRQVEADAFVVASGAWTPFLNQHLGCKLPIQPGKGYSLTMPVPDPTPRFPMIFEEHRVAVTPLKNKYRIGSTMEFAGYDTSINKQRLELLKSSAEHYLHVPYCEPVEEEWYGWRPMTWDGKPVIDRSPALSNVWIAAGHNMLGISMAPGTGRLVSELVTAESPHIDVAHYGLSRFHA